MVVANRPARPLLVFDGDCGFCRTWVARWRRAVGERIDYEPYQTAAARFPAIPRRQFRDAVQLIMPDGDVFQGAEAVLRSLALAPDRAAYRRWLIVYATVPGCRPVADWTYRWVADHRPMLSRLTHFWLGPPPPELDGPAVAAYEEELEAARRRRLTAGAAAGLGAVLLLGGWAGWRLRRRRTAPATTSAAPAPPARRRRLRS